MEKTKEEVSSSSYNADVTALGISSSDLCCLEMDGIEDPITVKAREAKLELNATLKKRS